MTRPEELIHKLYTSFPIKDWKTMQSCYHDEAVFSDPVFQNLTSKEVKAMWHMLSAAAQDLKVHVKEETGSCRWQAWYTFSRSGRKVHNDILANFEFRDGKIYRHADHFDLWRWSRMALGLSGVLLGWTPLLRSKIRRNARKGLAKFIHEHPEYQ
jgi:ketosteroid isomerase-like protein